MKTKIVGLAMGMILLISAAAWAASGDARFSGGSHDGWDRQATDGYASLTVPARGTVVLIY